MLRQKIREGNIAVREETRKKLTCYFCVRPIQGKGLVLEIQSLIKGHTLLTEYSVHEHCYQDSTRYLYDEWNRITFSLS